LTFELITGIALGFELLEDPDFGDQFLCIELLFVRIMIPIKEVD